MSHAPLPRAALKMLGHLTMQYHKTKRPMCADEMCVGAYVSQSHGRSMLPMLREAGLIIYVGTAEQAGRTDLQSKVAMFAPKGAMPLPRVVRPLEIHEKPLPENHSLGARSAVQINPLPERPRKQKYKGEINPPRYVPPFEEMTPDKYDLWQGRNLAMLAR